MDSIGRRELLRCLGIAAAGVSAPWLGLVPSVGAQVQIPSEFDNGLDSIAVAFKAPSGMTLGYWSQPKAAGMRPGIVMLHDVAGLSAGVRGMARSVANSGYAVVAPDVLSVQGGTAGFRGNDAEVQKTVAAATAATVGQQLSAALGYVKTHGGGGGKGQGLIGYGWGGTQTMLYAAGRKDVAACVAFYPDPKLVLPALAKLTAPTFIVFAGDDPATKEGAASVEMAVTSGKLPHVVKVQAGVQRNFHDPGAGAKIYNAAGAKEVWTAVQQHLDQNLKDAAKEKPKASAARESARAIRYGRERNDTTLREVYMAVSILRTRRTWGAVLALVAIAAVAGWSSQQQVQAQGRRTVWDKIYTADQAAKGKTDFETSCSGCHGITLEGGRGRPLTGTAFTTKWDFQSVNQLFNEIKTRMPRDQPGSLTPDSYLGIVAYILQFNKFPAGETPLVADAKLASTFITRSANATAKSAEAITTGTLVQVVGCLDGAAGAWKLTKSSEPVRSETPDASSAEELKQLASAAAGSGSYALLGIYAPIDEHKGHRMEAKAFIVKDPDGDRLNVVSLEPVATACQ